MVKNNEKVPNFSGMKDDDFFIRKTKFLGIGSDLGQFEGWDFQPS